MDVFIDGACTGNNSRYNRSSRRAGCGVYFPDGQFADMSVPIDDQFVARYSLDAVSNQVAEISALYWALRVINDAASGWMDDVDSVTFYTDSSYVENIFTKWVFDWRENGWRRKTYPFDAPKHVQLVKKVDAMLDELVEKHNVRVLFRHVDAHRSAPSDKSSQNYYTWHGNDEADRLARKATAPVKKNFR